MLIRPKIENAEFWYCNFDRSDLKHVCNPVGFWRSVMEYWADYNFHEITDIEEVLHQQLWLNSHVRINKKLVVFKEFTQQGIYEIIDLIDKDRIEDYDYISNSLGVNISRHRYYQLTSAIPKRWKKLIKEHAKDILMLS